MIKLLDNKEYNRKDTINKMVDDNFYYGELNKLALSSSSIKLLLDSPKKYYYVTKYGNEETNGLRMGTLLHTIILEPEKWDKFHFVDVQSKNTKAYKLAKEEFGTVYTQKEKEEAERMADAILKNEQALRLLNGADYEVPMLGEVQGMPFRGKADILRHNGIVDIKTTSDIKAFPYSAKKYGYDVQVYLYCQLFGFNFYDFKFLVIDKGSLDIGIWEVSEEFYLQGKEKVAIGIQRYKDYFINGESINDYVITGIL